MGVSWEPGGSNVEIGQNIGPTRTGQGGGFWRGPRGFGGRGLELDSSFKLGSPFRLKPNSRVLEGSWGFWGFGGGKSLEGLWRGTPGRGGFGISILVFY